MKQLYFPVLVILENILKLGFLKRPFLYICIIKLLQESDYKVIVKLRNKCGNPAILPCHHLIPRGCGECWGRHMPGERRSPRTGLSRLPLKLCLTFSLRGSLQTRLCPIGLADVLLEDQTPFIIAEGV